MELYAKYNAKAIEEEIRRYLDASDVKTLLQHELKKNNNGKLVGYIEGPPTMNGEPHAGHLRGRIIKDSWYRYNVLQKRNVVFRAGWDTQGLPVELQAEKELGLTGSKIENIRKVGVEKIVETCKKLIKRYNDKWIAVDKLLGMMLNYKEAYWTYHDEYIEREWKYLKSAWTDKILKEWFRVVAYCPSCQTSLSNAEVNQGYETIEDPSFYYKVRLSEDDVFLIIWTTMPFTIVTDEMVGVNPDAKYVHIRVRKEEWIVGEDRLQDLMKELQIEEFSIVKVILGKDLDGLRYIHPLLTMITGLYDLARKAPIHRVVAEKFVDITTGSGIVHLSPANGQEDFQVAEKRNIPVFVPIDDKLTFTEQAGIFGGLFVRDADDKVVEEMKRVGGYVKLGKIKHQYPTCWRSHHKLVWIARREYFYMIDRLGDKPLNAAKNVEYFFDPPKNRYLEIIKEKVPWCISRERLWGTPLPIWTCPECQHKIGLFSRNEIVNKATTLPDGPMFELHRPQIDRIEIICEKCGTNMEREPFVLDTWHNSGAAPYASLTDDDYLKLIPARFMTEGIDQTRGWAYTLLILNIILNQRAMAPFRSFLFQGHVLDEKGNKMSKSLGNVIDGYKLLYQNSVDLVRFYFMWKSSPVESLNFSLSEIFARPYQIISTLYYLHVYFRQNSIFDGFDQAKNKTHWSLNNDQLSLTEIWLLSKLQHVIVQVTHAFEKSRFHEGAKAIEDFIINYISQTYIPLTRNDIWDDKIETLNRRLTVYSVLGHALKEIDVLLHPFSPFITEYLYLVCFPNKKSVILEKWPKDDEKFVNREVEYAFDKSTELISLSNAARMKAQLKRRWPIKQALICSSDLNFVRMNGILNMLKNQLNVEDYSMVEFQDDSRLQKIINLLERKAPIIPKIKLSKKNVGSKAKGDLGKIVLAFENVNNYEVLKCLESSGKFSLCYEGGVIDLTMNDLELLYDVAEGYAMAEKDSLMIFIETKRDKRLIVKGLMRDLARNLQQFRKERGCNPTDILSAAYITDLEDEELSILSSFIEDLKYLVRVRSVVLTKQPIDKINYRTIELDGRKLRISVE
jgi:isoleucyl-tRNA synthetase